MCTCAWPRTSVPCSPVPTWMASGMAIPTLSDPPCSFLYWHAGLRSPQQGHDWAALVGTERGALREAETVGWPHPELLTVRSIRKCPFRKWHPQFRLDLVLPGGPRERASVGGCGLLRLTLVQRQQFGLQGAQLAPGAKPVPGGHLEGVDTGESIKGLCGSHVHRTVAVRSPTSSELGMFFVLPGGK